MMKKSNYRPAAKFLFWTPALPTAGTLLFFIPYLNGIVFSLHGGVGWLLLMSCGPFTLTRLLWGTLYSKGPKLSPTVALSYLVLYAVCTAIIALPASRRVEHVLGFKFQGACVWSTLNLPWSLIYSRSPCQLE